MKRLVIAALLFSAVLMLGACTAADITVTKGEGSAENSFPKTGESVALTVNISSGTFHMDAECRYTKNTKEENKKTIFYSNIALALEDGYKPCSACAQECNNMEENHD